MLSELPKEEKEPQRHKQITFHTFRHWKATMEYHKTRDILHVMQVLATGAYETMMHTQLVDFQEDNNVARITPRKHKCVN
jgi:hypothetical protein